ncbi:MAG: hypothetical protein JW818_19135 [Pirellulales bacterium]|nr:hypothetical protein [Pirellulales bacterium]
MMVSNRWYRAKRVVALLAFVAIAAAAGSAWAQNMQFPSEPPPSVPPPSIPSPSMPAPALSPPNPLPVTPGQVPGPAPTFQGPLTPPPPNWDPYGPYNPSQSSSLWPEGGSWEMPSFEEIGKMQRFVDELRLDYHFLGGRGSNRFSINDVELYSRFAFPMFGNAETPLYVQPGFAFHWWYGPYEDGLGVPGFLGNLPPRVYDSYLSSAWQPQITPFLGADLGFRIGVYSDFKKVTSESIRYTGHGLFVLNATKTMKIKGGIVYLDRVRIKILPAAGVFIKNGPNEWDLFFPYPRIARQVGAYGLVKWWLYVRGEYGGGSWYVTADGPPGTRDQVDYNDLRCALGLECRRKNLLSGLAEVGVAFNRELLERTTHTKFKPSPTIFLRAGLYY